MLTQHDFANLQTLYRQQAHYCVTPYVYGTAGATDGPFRSAVSAWKSGSRYGPISGEALGVAGGVAAYTVEWLDEYKELVFEITLDGGVFLVNAHGAQHRFSPQASRQIWRRIVEILWWYPTLRAVNIQAGDFVVQQHANEPIALKLTTARELAQDPTPAEQIHAILGWLITASGYLSDGQKPFDRHMTRATFMHRMQAVLRRRFGDRAAELAQQQWRLFQAGVLAQQEDWLKDDCVLATYDRLHTDYPAARAWHETCQRWLSYAEAVHNGQLPASWWFPAAEIPSVLDRCKF